MQASMTKRPAHLRHILLGLSVLSWTVFVPAHANQMNLNSNNKASSTKNIYWNKASTEHSRANRIMNSDHDHEEDFDLSIDIRKLPQATPTNRTGSLSGLIESVRNKVSGTEDAPEKLLSLNASAALVMDSNTGEVLYGKNIDATRPIASISKLMTSIVILDARLPMDEMIKLLPEDFIGPKKASSSLRPHETYNRAELLLLTLMHSENPAAAALARTYDKGRAQFMSTMNSKAKQLGMNTAFFGDPTGLDRRNASSPRDLAKLVKAAYEYEVIRRFSTTASYNFQNDRGVLHSVNTNALVRSGKWNIGLSKTGNINEAGHCVVMEASVNRRPTVIVLLDARSSQSRTGDAHRILSWLGNHL